jgi:broad specificity phosphatase PhoE
LDPHALLKSDRRRIYLMRHGCVDYFRPDGSAVPPDGVTLNLQGRAQADSAGDLFARGGVRFDKVLASGLPRTLETAERVLVAAGQRMAVAVDPRLQEIRPGRLADIPPDQLAQAFLGAFSGGGQVEAHRFLGGESVGELLDRVLPALDDLLADTAWHSALVVLHGGVNRAIISRVLAGSRAFFGRIEQAPACINIIDVGADDLVLRAVNLAPTQWLHERERHTTMEKLLAQFLKLRQSP